MGKSDNHLILLDQQNALDSSNKGAYILTLNIAEDAIVTVGKLGAISFPAGVYAYVGSALGPAGLQRVRRHVNVFASHNTNHTWHIDYLSTGAALCRVYVFVTDKRLECALASCLRASAASSAIKRFGSSDCKCDSHLFHVTDIHHLEREIKNMAGIFGGPVLCFKPTKVNMRAE